MPSRVFQPAEAWRKASPRRKKQLSIGGAFALILALVVGLFSLFSASPATNTEAVADTATMTVTPAEWQENFDTPASAADFKEVYKNSWCPYPDGTGGKYFDSAVSAEGGNQKFTLDGVHGAAGNYGPPGNCWKNGYGKYEISFKVSGATGYHAALMLWPSETDECQGGCWKHGEINVAEGDLSGNILNFQHPVGCKTDAECAVNVRSTNTGAVWQDQWHRAAVEWTPDSVTWYLDGVETLKATDNVPELDHRFILQLELPDGVTSPPGEVLVDWIHIYGLAA